MKLGLEPYKKRKRPVSTLSLSCEDAVKRRLSVSQLASYHWELHLPVP